MDRVVLWTTIAAEVGADNNKENGAADTGGGHAQLLPIGGSMPSSKSAHFFKKSSFLRFFGRTKSLPAVVAVEPGE
jgi:hypothetical protein